MINLLNSFCQSFVYFHVSKIFRKLILRKIVRISIKYHLFDSLKKTRLFVDVFSLCYNDFCNIKQPLNAFFAKILEIWSFRVRKIRTRELSIYEKYEPAFFCLLTLGLFKKWEGLTPNHPILGYASGLCSYNYNYYKIHSVFHFI